MKSWLVHLKNKYPGCKVISTETSMDVYDVDGEHLVALRKNGAGQWADHSQEFGCSERHCLAPIPKEARLYKVHKESGHIVADELYKERVKGIDRFACDKRRKILSCEELKARGWEFDREQRITKEPPKKLVSPTPQAPAGSDDLSAGQSNA